MGERHSGWFPLGLLTILAVLTFWLDRVVQPPAGEKTGAVRHDPDYMVDGLSAVRMDPQGRIKHTLRAQKMTHYPDDDITVLVEPRFVTYTQENAPVTVTSRAARVSGNGDDVYFEDQVQVVRAPHADQSELILETDYLHVIPDENLAKTDRPVTIRNATAVITATGLELNSATRVLKLQGRVKGIYDRAGIPPRNAR